MLKTTTGKSHEEVIKLPRNRVKSEKSLMDRYSYFAFRKNTGCKHISQKTRSEVIKRINDLIIETVTKGHYNIRIPNLGIVTLIKHKSNISNYHGKVKRGDMVPKVHVYFQVSGEERRVSVLDFDFIAPRKQKRKLIKDFSNLEPTLKESI